MKSSMEMNKAVLVVEPRLAHSLWIRAALQSASVEDYRIERDPLFALDTYLSGSFGLVLAAWPFKIDGSEWITAAKSLLSESRAPVVAMVADADKFRKRLALKNGADDVISKPFRGADLIGIFRRYAHGPIAHANVVDLDRYRNARRIRDGQANRAT